MKSIEETSFIKHDRTQDEREMNASTEKQLNQGTQMTPIQNKDRRDRKRGSVNDLTGQQTPKRKRLNSKKSGAGKNDDGTQTSIISFQTPANRENKNRSRGAGRTKMVP